MTRFDRLSQIMEWCKEDPLLRGLVQDLFAENPPTEPSPPVARPPIETSPPPAARPSPPQFRQLPLESPAYRRMNFGLQARVLRYLCTGSSTAAVLAGLLNLKVPVVNNSITKLRNQDYLTIRGDVATLTEKGRAKAEWLLQHPDRMMLPYETPQVNGLAKGASA